MNAAIKLIKSTESDLELLYDLQVKAFLPLYQKYQDTETSPALESKQKLLSKICSSDFYIVYIGKYPIGGIRINEDKNIENIRWISPLFIIPEYQNRGIATNVLHQIFTMYNDTVQWKLATIKQEDGNCHLYEKCGFKRIGNETVVNDTMTLIKYAKSCVESRRFCDEDADTVSQIITRNFIEVNSKDYGIEKMQELAKVYDAEKVKQTASYAHTYVFEWNGIIVGTGSISSFWGSKTESILLTIFVLPEHHQKGIGREIINTLEKDELFLRANRIEIPASITATEFYRTLGYEYKNGMKELDEEGHYRLEKFKESK